MNTPTHGEIARQAENLWRDRGCPAGNDTEIWLEAERQLSGGRPAGSFSERAKAVGDTLGFGACEKWTIDTDRYQVVGLNHDDSFLILLRRKDATQEDLETAVNEILE